MSANEIRIGRKVITPSAEVVFALGVYLCVRAGERVTREEVSETFWGAGRESQGRHSLRQMLYRLRQKGFTLDEDGEELYLDPARVDSDVAAALADGWPDAASAREVEAAGQVAPGFARVLSERFNEWLDSLRDRVGLQHRRACLNQIARARREGRWADLDRWALQVLRTDPLNEEATLARAESAAISGSKAVALEILDSYAEELGDRAAVIGLPASVLRRRIAERGAEWRSRGPSEVQLVGREGLMARLTSYVDAAARGESSAVFLWGAPGIGKTRLAEEVTAYARLAGFRVVAARAIASDGRPHSLVLSLISALLAQPGALGAEPSSLAILRRVTAGPPVDGASPLAAFPSLHDALLAAFSDVLSAVSDEGRLVLVTDDIHNADEASARLLYAEFQRVGRRRVLWIATTRSRPDRQWTGSSSITHILVPPLAPDFSRELAVLLAADSHIESGTLDSLSSAAGGNPLFVRELVIHARTGDTAGLPRSLRDHMTDRLDRMDGRMLQLLRYASLLGPHATVPRLRQLLHRDDAFSDTVEAAEAQGLLRVTPQRSIELHECWSQALDDGLGPVTRCAMANDCACLLVAEEGAELALSWHVATLMEQAGARDSALAQYCHVVERMLASGLPRDGYSIIERALSLARTAEERTQVLLLRAQAENASSEYERVVSTTDEALGLLQLRSAASRRRHALLTMLQLDSLARLRAEIPSQIEIAASLAADSQLDPLTRHHVCYRGLCLVAESGHPVLVQHFFENARIITQAGSTSVDGFLTELIYSAERGDVDGVLVADRALEALDRTITSGELHSRVLRSRAMAMRFIGETGKARELGERALLIARKCLSLEQEYSVVENLVHASLDLDDLESAASWLRHFDAAVARSDKPNKTHALAHARTRHLCQSGRFQEALLLLDKSEGHRARDKFRRRHCIDLSLAAYCAVGAGEHERGNAALRELARDRTGDRPSLMVDIYTELQLRTMEMLGQTEATTLGESYAAERLRHYPTKLAPFFRTISKFVEAAIAS